MPATRAVDSQHDVPGFSKARLTPSRLSRGVGSAKLSPRASAARCDTILRAWSQIGSTPNGIPAAAVLIVSTRVLRRRGVTVDGRPRGRVSTHHAAGQLRSQTITHQAGWLACVLSAMAIASLDIP
jgi:hypothetical protein